MRPDGAIEQASTGASLEPPPNTAGGSVSFFGACGVGVSTEGSTTRCGEGDSGVYANGEPAKSCGDAGARGGPVYGVMYGEGRMYSGVLVLG